MSGFLTPQQHTVALVAQPVGGVVVVGDVVVLQDERLSIACNPAASL